MKKSFLVFTLLLAVIGIAVAQTTVDFDTAANWIAGSASLTSYASDHVYTDGVFSATGGPALRQTTTAQDGFPGALGTYSWRLRDVSTVVWTMTIASGGVASFSIDIRRWDGSPSPNYNLDYSTDNGATWSFVALIDNAALDNSSAWKTFNGAINSANSNILIKISANGSTERIMVDNFVWTGYSGGNPPAATPVISPGSGTFFTAFNAEITCTTPGASIYYTLDGTDPDLGSDEYLGPININSTTTLKARAYADGYDPSAIATAIYTFPTVITVSNIAELRAGTVGSQVYYLSGPVILTFQQAMRHQKFIQDDTAAIMIDDPSGVITTPYDLYDGITGIYGTLTLYHELLEFVPVLNTAPATSTGNVVVPEVRTLDSLTPADQAKLIKVVNVTLDATSGNFLTYAQNIDATQGATTLTMRTFPSTDYSGTPIPSLPQNITCLVGQYDSGMQFSPRFLSDFEPYDDGTVPVELSSFTALLTAENSVKLSWVTQTETGVQGYYLYRNSSDALGNAILISPLIEGTNSSEQQSYSFTDAEIFEPGTYYYWLQNVDYDGATDFHGPVSVVYSIDNEGITPELPQQTKLLAVYPNPFNPTAIIPFSLAKTAEVNIRVFNSRGQLMRDFGLSTKAPGSYQIAWDGRDANGSECGSGVYYFVLQAGKDYFQRKAVLVK